MLQFAVSAVVGIAVVIGGAWVVTRLGSAPAAQAALPITVTDQTGAQVEFGVQPGTPTPLEALPDTSTIQLTSYEEPAASTSPGDPGGKPRAPWLSDSIPRIPAVTQFDGGPLQGVNCVMASGAMLARLAYGIVTTGSQLRSLSGDTEGPTGFGELQRAVFSGWGVRFSTGAATPLQLRALLYAGAGALVVLAYGEVPVGIRLSKNFTGNHAVYIDGFRPAGADGPAAYFVMDPIGHVWAGYKGSWWPAEVIERAATAYGGGKVAMAWAFAGGIVPLNHPLLPKDAYPAGTPQETTGPGETQGPTASGGPLVDHVPFGDLPLEIDSSVGTEPPDAPQFPGTDFSTGLFQMDSKQDSLRCTAVPAPRDCPSGIIGILGIKDVSGTSLPLKFLYANAIGPGMYQVIYESPPGADSELVLWQSTDGGTLEKATIDSGLLGGMSVKIATFTVDPTLNYSFVATTTSDGIRSVSDVGSLLVQP